MTDGARRASQAARERLAVIRRREKRRRAAWTAAVAVAVLVVAGLAGIGIWYATRPDDGTAPANLTADGHGVPVGDGAVTVEVYLDFICPACRQFHEVTHGTLDRYLADGTITLVYRPIAILDRYSTTAYSTRAASASGCAADVGMMNEFVAAMMAAQPPEGSAGLSNDEIVEVAAGAGVTGEGFARCVRDEPYRDWVGANTDAAFARGVRGTPTVYVDGALLTELSLAGLTAAIDAAAG